MTLDEPAIDGRTARRQRTRQAIVDAVAALIDEGDLTPTGPRIAARAGISLRSINLHFEDREGLLVAVAERMVGEILERLEPVDIGGERSARVEAFTTQRAQLLEALSNVSRASEAYEPSSAALRAWRGSLLALGRAEVVRVFRPEVDTHGVRDDELVAALDLAAGQGAWDWLRRSGLDEDEARAVMRRTVWALLDTADLTGGAPASGRP